MDAAEALRHIIFRGIKRRKIFVTRFAFQKNGQLTCLSERKDRNRHEPNAPKYFFLEETPLLTLMGRKLSKLKNEPK